jgi:DNA-binding CsgD family transcriptional regulator
MIDKLAYREEISKMLLNHLDINEPSSKQLKKAEKLFLRMRLVHDFDPKLSINEVKCLFLIAHGYTAPKIARELKTKLSTIESCQKEIRRKLNCKTIAEAVRIGFLFNFMPLLQCEKGMP